MKIDSGYVSMTSVTKHQSITAGAAERFVIRSNTNSTPFSTLSGGNEKNGNKEITYNQANSSLTYLQERYRATAGIRKISDRQEKSAMVSFKEQCLMYIFHLLFERRGNHNKISYTPSQDVNMEYQRIQYYRSEEENTAFRTQGTVRTADGREISFNLDVEMSQQFEEYYEETYGVANIQMCDPLVLNFDGNTAELSDVKFKFDLDADGELDSISRLQSGSGYLALDKNGDGIINDGSELFGTKSGDGFADLAMYDEDGNGWIDENDSIWSKLLIWCQDESGKEELYHLSEKGVGAICLQRVSTDFTLRDGANQPKGAIRSTGVFLYEDGNVGTVQHLDIAK